MMLMSEQDNSILERRADHKVRQAVDNIQQRFLDRVGERVARGLSSKELSEELILESLRLVSASYGCVLRPLENGELALDASVIINLDGAVTRKQDRLINSTPDDTVKDVLLAQKPVFSNDTSDLLLRNLPSSAPAIGSIAVFPIVENGSVKSLLMIANAKVRFDLVTVKRLQSMLNAFIRVHINSIINRGINNVIAGVTDTNRQLASVLEASYNAILTVDDHLRITAFNPACERLFGVNEDTALGSFLTHFINHECVNEIERNAANYSYSLRTNDEHPYAIEDAQAIFAKVQRLPIDIKAFHVRTDGAVHTTLVIHEIGNEANADDNLQNTLHQYRTLTQLAPVGIIKLDEQWLCKYANTMWCQLSTISKPNNLGAGWIEAIQPADQSHFLSDMRAALLKGDIYTQTYKLNTGNNNPLWVSFNATALLDNLNSFKGALIVVMDITDQYEAKRRFKQIAHHDPLTKLPNRTNFLEKLYRLFKQREAHAIVCLMFIDIDGFKAVNDTLGHDAGDELLSQVGVRIKQAVLDGDTVARLGGDEFTVTFDRLKNDREASLIADAIVFAIKQPFLLQQEEVYVSASIGIAMATGANTDTTADAGSLIKQADIALCRAKLSGRSRYIFFTPGLDQARSDRSILITSLRRAVDRQDFELFYQPQLLINENRLLGFEALLRWPQPEGGYISPGVFIDVLEETGLIGELGEWAISQACAQHRIWLRRGLVGPATTISVNVSARQLSTPNFVDRLAGILERQSMRPDSLILEITESTLVQTVETNIINEVKALGVQISLDDFGTGYSSLAYLSQLPLDHLKIDRSFIADIGRLPHAVAVIKSIIALAKTLGIRVIAEGVESANVLPLLANEGCEGYQGYHFSKPLPAREMANKLRHLKSVQLNHYANFIDLGN